MITYSLESLAKKTNSELVYASKNQTVLIEGLASLAQAQKNHISFLSDAKMHSQLAETKACAVILKEQIKENPDFHQLIHPNPYLCMIEIAKLFYPLTHPFEGQHLQSCSVGKEVSIHPSAQIGPFVFIADNVSIGAGSVIYPHSYIGAGTSIGEGCVIYSNVSIYPRTLIGNQVTIHSTAVIGSDGFGFLPTKDSILKIPQVGKVVIEDDVEIGAGTTIDRATFDETVIKRGCKIDSQVHIGHNVVVGEETMLCGQVGIAGSAQIGKRCIAAGRAGVSQGIRIADHVVLGAASVALQDIQEPGEYQGHPAVPSMGWRREVAAKKQLPDLIKRIKILEKLSR